MKICVIGGGSSYTPELIEGFIESNDELPVENVTLMDIDTRKCPAGTHAVDDPLQHAAFLAFRMHATGPDAVVIRLPGKAPQAVARSLDIADKKTQRARQLPVAIVLQQSLQRMKAGGFIAMQQQRQEQRLFAPTRQMNQRWATQKVGKLRGGGVDQAGRHFVVLA